MNGNFAAGAIPGITTAIRVLGLGQSVREQAQWKSGLMAAQAARTNQQTQLMAAQADNARQQAQEVAHILGLRQDPTYLAELDAQQNGLGALYRGGYDLNKAPSGMLDLQKHGWNQQILNNIGDPETDHDKINLGTSVLEGKTYEPFAALGDTGYALNKATGQGVMASPGIAALYGQKAAADATLKAAQAREAGRKWDSARGGFADAGSGTFQPAQVVGGATLPPANDPSRKPLPPVALKMQQEALESMGLLSSINADLGAIRKQIQDKTLDLGPWANRISEGWNRLGHSTPGSRAYASFIATLQKLRNDSLRLNKGVQTEGDAQRAWDELLKDVTDNDLVMHRLGEIIKIDQRAAELRGLTNDAMRANFGYDPMDYSQYLKAPVALGVTVDGKPPSAANAHAVEFLRANPDKAAEFDAKFGPGEAAKILGR